MIELTDKIKSTLKELPNYVEDTFYKKLSDIEKNLEIGAEPEQAFHKRMKHNMHPVLQMKLGSDYRAWFIEGKYIKQLEDDKIYGIMALTKDDQTKLSRKIDNVINFFERVL